MLKRTPPSSPAGYLGPTPTPAPLPGYSKDVENLLSKVNVKPRRKKLNEESDQLDGFMAEIKNLISELKLQQDLKLDSLTKAVSEIKIQNAEIQRSMEFLSASYDEMVKKVVSVQNDCTKNKEHIKHLENKIELLERNARSASIEIRNIPKQPSETKSTLCNLVKKTGIKVDCIVRDSDIRTIFRTKTKNETQSPIIVEFATAVTKEELLKSTRLYNKNNSNDKLNTAHLDIVGTARPVYVSENLTSKAKRLYYLARELSKDRCYAHCWTLNGQVFLRKTDGAPHLRINSEEDLVSLRKEK